MDIGDWLKEERKKYEITLDEAAKRAGVSVNTIYEIENKKRKSISLDTAQKITKSFGIELWRWLKTSGEK